MTVPVKLFRSTDTGAPVLSGTAGARIAVLDAVLVNGYNLQTLTGLAVAGGVLTGTKAGHGFVVDQVIETAGAVESVLNTQWRITATTSNTFTAEATGIANVTGSGTITAKAAPAGWAKVFSGTNKAVYRSNDATGTRMYLRVDDANALNSRVVGYEAMTTVDAGTKPFPTAAQMSGGLYWPKSDAAGATEHEWCICADSRGFYAKTVYHSSGFYSAIEKFGDFTSEKSGDAYAALLVGWIYDITGTSSGGWAFGIAGAQVSYSPRSYSQSGTSIEMGRAHPSIQIGPNGAGGFVYPSPASNRLVLGTTHLWQGSVLRCLALPGLYCTAQASPLANLDVVTDVAALPGRRLLCLSGNYAAAGDGRVFIDLTGPWR